MQSKHAKFFSNLAAAALLFLFAACSASTTRTYDMPAGYVAFAAKEACATAGFYPIRAEKNALQIEGDRALIPGFLIGQGGEHIHVTISELNNKTTVTVLSEKQFLGFLAQRHMQDRVAAYIDAYVHENGTIKEMLRK